MKLQNHIRHYKNTFVGSVGKLKVICDMINVVIFVGGKFHDCVTKTLVSLGCNFHYNCVLMIIN